MEIIDINNPNLKSGEIIYYPEKRWISLVTSVYNLEYMDNDSTPNTCCAIWEEYVRYTPKGHNYKISIIELILLLDKLGKGDYNYAIKILCEYKSEFTPEEKSGFIDHLERRL